VKILILHGWGHSKDYWRKIVDMLGKDAMAIDLPGFGSEDAPSNDWGVADYASWVHKKILNTNEVVLIGHSFGGRVAASVASRRPKNLKALILTGAPCLRRPTLSTKLKIVFAKLAKIFYSSKNTPILASDDYKESGRLEGVFRRVVVYDQEDELRKIAIPTLLIWGERDASVPTSIAKEMTNMIEKSELVIIENTGHNLFLENPNLFYGSIKKFISNL